MTTLVNFLVKRITYIKESGERVSFDSFFARATITNYSDGKALPGKATKTVSGNSIIFDQPEDTSPFIDLPATFRINEAKTFASVVLKTANGTGVLELELQDPNSSDNLCVATFPGARIQKTTEQDTFTGPNTYRFIFDDNWDLV
jgi:hypothetical protein